MHGLGSAADAPSVRANHAARAAATSDDLKCDASAMDPVDLVKELIG
jgi:hypothetical protein